MIGLDNFSSINNLYGHHYGDELLLEIAKRLKRLYPNANLARSEGDRFLVIFCVKDKELLTPKAYKILEFLNES